MRLVARERHPHLHGPAILVQRQFGILGFLVHPVGHLLGQLIRQGVLCPGHARQRGVGRLQPGPLGR